jgi:hypothetical protein
MIAIQKPLAIIVHVLHNAMRWETADSIVGEWKFWDCTFLKTIQHTTLHCIYYTLHFTVYFLKSTSTDANRTLMLYLTKHITMKV